MIYGYDADKNIYNVFNHHEQNLMKITPASYSSSEELFSDFNNANTSLKIFVNTTATKSVAVQGFNTNNHAFIVISF